MVSLPAGYRVPLLAVLPENIKSAPGPVSFTVSNPHVAGVHVHNSRALAGAPAIQTGKLIAAAAQAIQAGNVAAAAELHLRAIAVEDDPFQAELETLGAGTVEITCRTGELVGNSGSIEITPDAAAPTEPVVIELA